jgi:autotransporter-associated beta strand protein
MQPPIPVWFSAVCINPLSALRVHSWWPRPAAWAATLPGRRCLALGLGLALAATLLGTTAVQAQRALGIDVSSYQGSYQNPPVTVNWTSVKSTGIVFAWTKATEGASFNDADFTYNITNGKAAGVYMGAYHYAHPELNSPATEASHFWNVVRNYIKADGLTLMPMLDIEGSAFSGNVGASSISDWINQWCTDVVQDAANNGVSITPAIYVSACNACPFDSSVSQWYCDIADYNGANPQTSTPWTTCTSCERWGSGAWDFWQYTSSGSVSGVNGRVDCDVFNGTAATLASTMLAIASTNSTIYYWDPQGTTGANPYTGSMSGTWENAKWSYGSSGLATPVNWVNGKAACFGVHTGSGTPAYTVTMNSSHVVAGFFDGPLSPNACDVTIQGSGTINLASGAQALDCANASDGSKAYLRINCPIAGDGQLVPEGNGQSFLHATNSFTGGTQLGWSTVYFSGTVNFNNAYAFGTGPITLTSYGNGGSLVLEGASAVTITNPVTLLNATTNNLVGNAAGLTFSGNWSLGANLLRLGTGTTAGNQTIISGVVSGTAGLRVYNSGTLVLSGLNTYSGTTTIDSPAIVTVGSAGQLGSGAYSGSIVNNGTFNFNSTAAQTLSGVISGSGPVKVGGGGTLTLSGANTYTGGTTVSGGSTLGVTADSGLGGSTGGLTLNGGCLKNNNSSPTITASRTITLGANGGYLDAGWAPSHPLTINAAITGSAPLCINLDGSPVVLGSTANSYTGNTVIGTNGPGSYASGTQAWLKLGASGVIPNGAGKGSVIINQSYKGMLDLAGFSQIINGLSGDGVVTNSTTGNSTLTVGNNNASSTFSGVIGNTVGTLALTKMGSGTLTLTGANAYNGATTVSAGVLALGNGGSLGASTVTVASDATLANASSSPTTLGGTTTFNAGALGAFTAVGGTSSTIGDISVNGNLYLNGNTLTITVSGGPLAIGTYRLLDCTGTLWGAANTTPSITGTPLPFGYLAVVTTTPGAAGHVDLLVRAIPAFANLTASQAITYGASNIVVSGTLSAPGPLYPAAGETVSVTINANTQNTIINDATGDFSLTYNTATLPASGSAYSISYGYGGDASLSGANDATTTLTVNPRPVLLAGSRLYDATATAAAEILSVSNTVGSDVVSVASGSATLTSANPGSQAITSMETLTLGGTAAANYTLTGASGSVTITPFAIIAGFMDDTGTNFVLTWQSVSGLTYQVIGSLAPEGALNTWTNVGSPITASGSSTSVTNALTAPAAFFNIKTQ